MAHECMSSEGRINNFPRAGGWHDQSEDELYIMRLAHGAEITFRKPLKQLTGKERELYGWIDGNNGN